MSKETILVITRFIFIFAYLISALKAGHAVTKQMYGDALIWLMLGLLVLTAISKA